MTDQVSSESETWRPVLGFEGFYQVSNRGQIKRLLGGTGTYAGRIKKPVSHPAGYHAVALYQNKRRRCVLVHRVVVEAFIGPVAPGMTINHRNGDKLDNRLENLEIVTKQENIRHAARTGLLAGRRHGIVLTPTDVREIRRLYATGEMGRTALARRYGVTLPAIRFVVLRRTWKHVGDLAP